MSVSRPRFVCLLINSVFQCVTLAFLHLEAYSRMCETVSACVHSGIVVCRCKLEYSISTAAICPLMHLRVEFVLEDVQVVGGSNSDDVLSRVPGRVEDLLGEIQAVHADVVLTALSSSGTDPAWL